MLILQIMGGMIFGLLLLGLLSALRNVLESASSRGSTGIDLRRHRRLHTDWRVLESLSGEQD